MVSFKSYKTVKSPMHIQILSLILLWCEKIVWCFLGGIKARFGKRRKSVKVKGRTEDCEDVWERVLDAN